MEVICDHAGVEGCSGRCPHRKPHVQSASLVCYMEHCNEVQQKVHCIPVATKKDQDGLLGRLKDQITGTKRAQVYDTRVNQILIMEALVALLEGR